MAYQKIGVFGATGRLGQELTRAFVEEGFDIVPFSRQKTTVAGIPTQEVGSLVGFDVIVCTVGVSGLNDQLSLIEKAKKDGVKRFVPSEYGVDHRASDLDFFKPKKQVFEAVKAARFPDGWTAIITGFFDAVIPAVASLSTDSSVINVSGNGKTRYPFVFRHDLGRILAYTFKHPKEYKDVWLAIANEWLSGDDIAQIIQEASGKNLHIKHIEADEKKAPVIYLLERNGGNVFDPAIQTKDIPISLVDLRAHIRNIYTSQ
ncbi:hypothetical protein BGW36DRAFT_410779 [Talaromyces proteolyticus]|uniref:NmrA-like domain-containing protein n=1 Tax=Talaromyces proteolyticus TaxID=1131652 RepID=A0AAD4KJ39_9EURO|nr:uncharacterized protein BGW36DRAFT_410779 [Talaromyces proteolyticus]KAH8692347.1 hypothetical protein BGW36DRAFT_410779 [Talaromyces proteolyticus]